MLDFIFTEKTTKMLNHLYNLKCKSQLEKLDQKTRLYTTIDIKM